MSAFAISSALPLKAILSSSIPSPSVNVKPTVEARVMVDKAAMSTVRMALVLS